MNLCVTGAWAGGSRFRAEATLSKGAGGHHDVPLAWLVLWIQVLGAGRHLDAQACPGESAAVIFQTEPLSGHATFQSPELFASQSEEIGLVTSQSSRIYAAFVSDFPPDRRGIQGWSLSLAIDGDVDVLGATTEGTVAAVCPVGIRRGVSFELTEVVDPERNGGQKGVVSGVVLALFTDVTLNPRGTATVLAVDVRPAADTAERPIGTRLGPIRCQDGLQGSGQPADNVITRDGELFLPCECRSALLSVGEGEPTFEFGIALEGVECGGTVEAIQGVARLRGRSTLSTMHSPAAERGAQSWTLALRVDGAISVTTRGTAADRQENGGFRQAESFELSEVTPWGVASTVILDFQETVSLPGEGTQTVALFELEAASWNPAARVMYYSDGLVWNGVRVANAVTWEGREFQPVLGRCSFRLAGEVRPEEDCSNGVDDSRNGLVDCWDPDCWLDTVNCPENCTNTIDDDGNYLADHRDPACQAGCPCAPITIIFQSTRVLGEDGLAQVPYPFAGWSPEIATAPGRSRVYVGVVSQLDDAESGISAWSLSIAVEGMAPIHATTEGTIAALGPPGIRRAGSFEFTELASDTGASGAPVNGVISGVVLALADDVTLLPQGTATVLEIEVDVPHPVAGRIYCLDGLTGSGQEIRNTFVVGGRSGYRHDCFQVALGEAGGSRFLRGDPNDDGRVNIADSVWILLQLFHGGPEARCTKAADANDDRRVDLTDAVAIMDYRFRGGAAPRPPFPHCGLDAGGDGAENDLPCRGSAMSCP